MGFCQTNLILVSIYIFFPQILFYAYNLSTHPERMLRFVKYMKKKRKTNKQRHITTPAQTTHITYVFFLWATKEKRTESGFFFFFFYCSVIYIYCVCVCLGRHQDYHRVVTVCFIFEYKLQAS